MSFLYPGRSLARPLEALRPQALTQSPFCRVRCAPISIVSIPCQSRRKFSVVPPKKEAMPSQNGTVGDNAHQYQAGDTTHRKEDEWKHREPYRIHDKQENFEVKWNGSCHCGKVKYELSREKPLASKYCHCTTCQRLHGVRVLLILIRKLANSFRRPSNMPPSFTKPTSISPMGIMISAGTILRRRKSNITSLVRSPVPTAERPSWMKVAT